MFSGQMWNILEKFALKLNLEMDYIKQIVKGVNIYLFNIIIYTPKMFIVKYF